MNTADSGPAEPGQQDFVRQIMALDFVNRSPDGGFSAVAKNFGPVTVGRVLGTPSSFIRTRQHLADGRDLLSVIISGGGRFQVEGVQGLDRFAAHGAAILESRRESALHSLDDSSTWSIYMERSVLEPLLTGIHAPVQRCVSGDSPGLRLLDGYLKTLFSLEQECDAALAAQHIRDLTLNALGVTGDTQALIREGGLRAARLQIILARLAADASEPGLDPARLAERLGLSARYLHRLLEPTGRSFSEHLLNCRLERAAAMLRDQNCDLRIAEVARAAGFSDISHFNRSFRRVFGDTPYGVRVRTARRRTV